MSNLDKIRERYLKDSLPVRLGGLAANLARISSTVKNSANVEAVKSLIEESKYFIEWTAIDAEPETAAELIQIQIKLAVLQLSLDKDWNNEEKRSQIGLQAKDWSQSVLQNSGLV
jgi:hypothetical protein